MNVKIIRENKDYLVIYKPAGLIVHGGNGIKEKTLVDFLIAQYPELSKVGEDPVRPAIVHRLDKEVSGLMIIPKNNSAFEYFKEQFQNRKIKKEYLALVFGKIDKDEGIIDFPIKRSSQGHKMAAIPKTSKDYQQLDPEKNLTNRSLGNIKALESSRQAITEFSVLKRLINFTLLKVKIKTGRTHQIRVHFSAFGHPLLGDNLYGNKKSKNKNIKLKMGRIFLMANKLSFIDPSGDQQNIEIDMDNDLEIILKQVK